MRKDETATGTASRTAPAPAAPARPDFFVQAPTAALPKGGGALRGIGEKFSANPVTGTGAMSVPIAVSPGRAGFGPQLALSYDSGAGDGPFGLGWSLALPAIVRKTDKGLPRYLDDVDSDTFVLAGAEDLVPALDASGQRAPQRTLRVYGRDYRVRRYRPRIEGLFAWIECWRAADDASDVSWRTISRDNVTSWYGRTEDSRVVDPDDGTRIFQWLLCETHDDRGHVAIYQYQREDGAGVDRTLAFEANRPARSKHAATYLRRIAYGNRAPYLPTLPAEGTAWGSPPDGADDWMFEVLFDYGEYPRAVGDVQPALGTPGPWSVRSDPFSSHRAGFEVRTWRLCRRVLMLHHFPEDTSVGARCLVKSTDFQYREPATLDDPEMPGYTQLASVSHRSYQRVPGTTAADGYVWRELPPVVFDYSQPVIGAEVQRIAAGDLPNLPVGTQGPGVQWVDLDGEGLSGVLTEQAGAWHYAPNRGEGRFGPMRVVAQVPALAALGDGRQQLMDLDGDGAVELVDFRGPTPGFHARDRDEGWKRHVPFASLPNIDWQDENLRFLDLTGDGHADALVTEDEVFTWYPSMQAAGFGAPQRQRNGADEDAGPRLVFDDGTQTVFLADMCGDGLTDLVRIRNGSVCYWPNLGYGRFGRKVTMANAPRFDAPDLFDPRRIRLADIDGSGPIDLIYLGREGAQLYVNRGGNRFSCARRVPLSVATENLGAVQVADLLGTGTACLVWNSHLPADAATPVRYVPLMAEGKPHLLTRVDNSLDGATSIEYTPSTVFYLRDLAEGRPWITRLPFPVHCVSRVTTTDRWRGTRFSSTYSYHHGYFDGAEREFRGFGRVVQTDLDAFGSDDNVDSPWVTDDRRLFQPPVQTITWYHTGAATDRQRILGAFEREYFPARFAARLPTGASAFVERELPEPELPADLTSDEWREALRACKGLALRQETYELDLDALVGPEHREVPVRLYSVATHNCSIRRLQPRGANVHAVFHIVESEALSYQHELQIPPGLGPLAPDPRIAHALHLRHDEYGHPQQSVSVGYPRWTRVLPADVPQPDLIADVQQEWLLSYAETRYTTDALVPARQQDATAPLRHHRLRQPCDVRSYELTGLRPAAGRYFDLATLRRHPLCEDAALYPAMGSAPVPLNHLEYHQQPTGTAAHRRVVEHVRTLYFDDASDAAPPTAALPHGHLGPRGMAYESYKLALTDALLDAVFGDKLGWVLEPATAARAAVTCRMLLDEPSRSGYVPGTWAGLGASATQRWMRSGIAGFASGANGASAPFFLPDRYTGPFGNTTRLQYDPLHLYARKTIDALGNTTEVARFDHRVLAPVELIDANGNHVEVAHDIRGLVVAMAVKGKPVGTGWQLDDLDGFDIGLCNPPAAAVVEFCTTPAFDGAKEQTARGWLRGATQCFVYHFGDGPDASGTWQWAQHRAAACAIARETHARRVPAGQLSTLQIALECSDGSGAVLMAKAQAEPDPATPGRRRWLVNGLTLLNNKGKPVKQYEPTFSGNFGDEMPTANGVSTTTFYDAAGRVVRTEMPDGTFARVEFSPWHVKSFDANDTVLDSAWYRERGRDRYPPDTRPTAPTADQRAGWLAAQHANTPAEVHLDSLGREVIAIAHNRAPDDSGRWIDERSLTFTKLDAEGKPLWIRDALGHLVMQYISPPRDNAAPGEEMPAGAAACYDLAGNLLFQHSMDAGPRWSINDAAGKPLFGWDVYRALDAPSATAQKRLFANDYDALHRPTRHWLKFNDDPARLVEAFDYCDTTAPRRSGGTVTLAEAQARNLVGQAVRHIDPSGVASVERLDVGGQPIHLIRRLIRVRQAEDGEPALDWNVADREALLEAADETFHQLTEYDALGRMTRQANWHRPGSDRAALYAPSYSERGLLQAETLHLRAGVTIDDDGRLTVNLSSAPTHRQPAIVDIRYDAKGRKERLELGNGTVTEYGYDRHSQRLVSLRTQRSAAPRGLQDLAYTYDAAGNITTLVDHAQETVYTNNAAIEPKHEYVYDALYRLIEATGREDAQAGIPGGNEGPWPRGEFATATTTRGYRQRYRYDAVGNFLVMEHRPDTGTGLADPGWTRRYAYAFDDPTQPASNRLWRTWTSTGAWDPAAKGSVTYHYDSHGSMLNLNRVETPPPHIEDWGRRLTWDWRDMIRNFDAIGGGTARYHYGIDKQRTRKHITRLDGSVEDRLYLGGFERYQRRNANGVVLEEIDTHHLFEGEQRVLQVDDVIDTDRRHGDGRAFATGPLARYQCGNHLGSVALELDERARIISYEEYHPYGTAAFRLMKRESEAPPRRYRYTGMERDEESGLGYHMARSYAPWLARWIAPDPTGLGDGPHLYAYCHCSPMRLLDFTGKAGNTPPEVPNRRTPNSTKTGAEAHRDIQRFLVLLMASQWNSAIPFGLETAAELRTQPGGSKPGANQGRNPGEVDLVIFERPFSGSVKGLGYLDVVRAHFYEIKPFFEGYNDSRLRPENDKTTWDRQLQNYLLHDPFNEVAGQEYRAEFGTILERYKAIVETPFPVAKDGFTRWYKLRLPPGPDGKPTPGLIEYTFVDVPNESQKKKQAPAENGEEATASETPSVSAEQIKELQDQSELILLAIRALDAAKDLMLPVAAETMTGAARMMNAAALPVFLLYQEEMKLIEEDRQAAMCP